MKGLKITLGAIYPILIILLLLSNCRGGGCSRNDGDDRMERRVDDDDYRTPRENDDRALRDNDEESPAVEEPADTSAMVEVAERTGMSGELKITLLWDFPGDIDLHVMQPNGTEIFYRQKKDTSTGGFLDVDNVEGGPGAAENVAWSSPQSGEYQVGLNYYQAARTSGVVGEGVCTVVIFRAGSEPRTFRVPMRRVGDTQIVTKFNI